MAKIKKLSAQEAQKIAAGEVVERPANIVKELLENCLDAGSTQISIYVEDGGKKLIKVIDNGCGMEPEDALMSIEHHATSKITTVDDLETLKTFGFRGEALSSISAVSLMSIKTKTEDEDQGLLLNIEWAKVTGQEETSCNTGTEITVKNIFDNIPARKKFLKTKETELRAITQLFFAAVLSYKSVHFKFFSENKLIYNCPAVSDIKSRIAQLYDNNLVANIITSELEDKKNSIKISCAITGPEYTRYDRNGMFFFVNSRWVKNYKLSQATIKGYMNVLPDGKFPAAFIFIEIEPKLIDVNIHPRKDEVLFFNPKIVENAVQNCVRIGLEKYLSNKIKPASVTDLSNLDDRLAFNSRNLATYKLENNPNTRLLMPEPKFIMGQNIKAQEYKQEQAAPDYVRENVIKILNKNFGATQDIGKELVQDKTSLQSEIFVPETNISKTELTTQQNSYKIIGQLCKTYIITEVADGMLMVDQHAAHERILYEKFANKFEEIEKISLITPIFLYLQENDINFVLENLEVFESFGLQIEQFSQTEIVIKSAPVIIKKDSAQDIVKYIMEVLKEYESVNKEEIKKNITERIHAQMACKAAIKSGDILSQHQMAAIINDLYQAPNRLTCPHGRPTFWHCNISEINKKFKRPNISN